MIPVAAVDIETWYELGLPVKDSQTALENLADHVEHAAAQPINQSSGAQYLQIRKRIGSHEVALVGQFREAHHRKYCRVFEHHDDQADCWRYQKTESLWNHYVALDLQRPHAE